MNHPRRRFAAAAALAILVAVLAVAVASRYDRHLDLTDQGRWTLAPTTADLLAALPSEVRASAFFGGGPDDGAADRLRARLEAFRRASGNFDFAFVDPLAEPTVAAAYGIMMDRTLVLEADGRRETCRGTDEAAIARGLVRLFRRGERRVEFVAGHGERSIGDSSPDGAAGIAAVLRASGLLVGETMWLREEVSTGSGPEGVSVLVVAGPRDDVHPEGAKRFRAHVEAGGSVLLLLDPFALPGFERLSQEWGVVARRDVIVDPATRLYGADATVPVVTDYARHPITDSLTRHGVRPVFFPVARSLEPRPRPGLRVDPVALSSDRAWGEASLFVAIGNDSPPPPSASRPDSDDRSGPFPIAIAVEFDSGARVFVVGDSDFMANGNLDLSGNRTLLEGAVEWLLRGDEGPAFVAARAPERPLLLSSEAYRDRVTVPALILPGFAFASAAWAFFRRRR